MIGATKKWWSYFSLVGLVMTLLSAVGSFLELSEICIWLADNWMAVFGALWSFLASLISVDFPKALTGVATLALFAASLALFSRDTQPVAGWRKEQNEWVRAVVAFGPAMVAYLLFAYLRLHVLDLMTGEIQDEALRKQNAQMLEMVRYLRTLCMATLLVWPFAAMKPEFEPSIEHIGKIAFLVIFLATAHDAVLENSTTRYGSQWGVLPFLFMGGTSLTYWAIALLSFSLPIVVGTVNGLFLRCVQVTILLAVILLLSEVDKLDLLNMMVSQG